MVGLSDYFSNDERSSHARLFQFKPYRNWDQPSYLLSFRLP
jgi:hypothetical protein